jgi:hypothetical protein
LKRNIDLKRAGENVFINNYQNTIIKKIVAISIILLLFFILQFIIKEPVEIISKTLLFGFLITYINMNLYDGINGIYTNGIIYNKYIDWKMIQSFMYFDSNISFALNKNLIIDYKNINNAKDNINKVLMENNIRGRSNNNALDFA